MNTRLFFRLILGFSMLGISQFLPAQTAVTPSSGDGSAATPYQITELGNLVWMKNRAAASATEGVYYELANDIDASATSGWTGGFTVIGASSQYAFEGYFDGQDHTISNLTISRSTTDYVGLFGYVSHSSNAITAIQNLKIEDCSITGDDYTGALAGYLYCSPVVNCSVTGTVSGSDKVGGLLGLNGYQANVTDCFTDVTVSGVNYAGGFVGNANNSTILRCYALGDVNATGVDTGGFAGIVYGTINQSYATGNVVSTRNAVGGFAGSVQGDITNCFATGDASSTVAYCGSFVGQNDGDLTNCYALGSAFGGTIQKGMIAYSSSTVSGSYWNTELSGATTSAGGTGMTSAEMLDASNFSGWNFTTIWAMDGGYPYLQALSTCEVTYAAESEGVIEDSLTSGSAVIQTINLGAMTAPEKAMPLASPNVFDQWDDASEDNPRHDNGLVADTVFTASFVEGLALVYTAGEGGTVDGETMVTQYVKSGKSGVAVQAIPGAGYLFKQWDDGSTANPRTDESVTGSLSVTAEFTDQVSLAYDAGDHGSLNAGQSLVTQSVTNGEDGSAVTVVPDEGYMFYCWSDYVMANPRIDKAVTENLSVTAYYIEKLCDGDEAPGNKGEVDGSSAENAYEIRTLGNLVWMANQAYAFRTEGVYYKLMNDIDASATAEWDDGDGGDPEGFFPIGWFDSDYKVDHCFEGVFLGQGFKIKNLYIDRPDLLYCVGLFGDASGAVIQDLGLEACSISGCNGAGGLVGYAIACDIANCYVSGVVEGESAVGGLAGYFGDGGAVENCYVAGIIKGADSIGGLAGSFCLSSFNCCYATGAVEGDGAVGGLIGDAYQGVVTNCYAASSVVGNSNAGGLIGCDSGGLVTDSYWDAGISGQTASDGSADSFGLTQFQMMTEDSYTTGWNFDGVWTLDGAYPYLDDLTTCTLSYRAETGGLVCDGLTTTSSLTQVINLGSTGVPVTAAPGAGFVFLRWDDGLTTTTRIDSGLTTDTALTAIFYGPDVITPGAPGVANSDFVGLTVEVSLDANGNLVFVEYAIQAGYGSEIKWVQADGSLGDTPVYLTMEQWAEPVVVTLPSDELAVFRAMAYDPELDQYSALSEASAPVTVPVALSAFSID